MRKPKVLFYDPFPLVTGGSGFRLCRAVDLLKEKCEITLLLPKKPDWDFINQCFGSRIREEEIRFVSIPPLSRRAVFFRYCFPRYRPSAPVIKSECAKNDLCVSFRNFGFFGVPGVHFIVDIQALEPFGIKRPRYQHWKPPAKISAKTLARGAARQSLKLLLSFAGLLGFKRRFRKKVQASGDRVISNSRWIADFFQKCHFHTDVIYPPVTARFPDVPYQEREFDFACVGRICPLKRIERIISILDSVRKQTGLPLTLRIVGRFSSDNMYSEVIREMAAHRDWIRMEGELLGQDKEALLLKCKYAIHACEIEAFGISVAEYVKAGCIPFVPSKGGSAEIVGLGQLCYNSSGDAVSKIIDFLNKDDGQQTAVQESMMKRGSQFNTDIFDREFLKVIGEELSSRNAGYSWEV